MGELSRPAGRHRAGEILPRGDFLIFPVVFWGAVGTASWDEFYSKKRVYHRHKYHYSFNGSFFQIKTIPFKNDRGMTKDHTPRFFMFFPKQFYFSSFDLTDFIKVFFSSCGL